jgi:site-specific recombinase XerD
VSNRQISLQRRAPNWTGTGAITSDDIRPADREDLTAFLDRCQSRGRSPKTIATYREAVEQLASYTAGKGMPLLASVRREHVEDFLGALRDRGNKPATVRNRFASLRAFFTWMQQDDLRTDQPMTRIPAPQIPEQLQPHYEPEQILAVMAAIGDTKRHPRVSRARNSVARRHGLRDKAMLLFLMDTGVRCQELCDIRVADVDREARSVEIVAGKGGKGRAVRFSSETKEALNAYVRTRGGWEGQDPRSPLFAGRSGEQLATNGVRMTLQRRFEAAGVPYRGTHGFRRTFGIQFLENGGDPTDLKELAGWSSWSMLHKYTKATARSRALRAHDEHSPVAAMLRKARRR